MDSSSATKAVIFRLDRNGKPVGSGIECMFNPTEYTFAKQNSWTVGEATGGNSAEMVFSKGEPATLQMELLFDTYGNGKRNEDVRTYTDQIWELMMVDPDLTQGGNDRPWPPKVRFQWGKTWTFNAVITSLSQKFTLFLADGTPVRATLQVSFKQIEDTRKLGAQNPTSGGEGGERVWRVNAGDTLAWIAYQEYGDPNRWRAIAAANRIDNVRRLTPGALLVIPNA